MFGGEALSAIGFGMGDVTTRDFLETHKLIPESVKSLGAEVSVIPETADDNIVAQSIAMKIRQTGLSVATDIGTQKTDKKKVRAMDRGSRFVIIVGQQEISSGNFTLKDLQTSVETSGTVDELIKHLA